MKQFTIVEVHEIFSVTEDQGVLGTGSDIRLVGNYHGQAQTEQVIVRRGAMANGLSVKDGAGAAGWALEVMLPPDDYLVFAGLARQKPRACSWDTTPGKVQFQIGAIW